MKSLIFGMALCAAAVPALAQTNVSVSVGQPGFFGRVDIGNFAPAPVVYAPQPVVIEPVRGYAPEPIYLRVPPGHRQHWARFCGRYDACGRPVLFVRDDWYDRTYVPAYREHHGRDEWREHERHEEREHERREWREDRDDDHGHGEGRGHGHGHGHGHDRD